MKRLPPAVSQTYADFWTRLVPQSNRQTGFSLHPSRRSFVEFDRVGFRFSCRSDRLNATATPLADGLTAATGPA